MLTKPYIHGVSERIARLLAHYDICVCHRPVNKLRFFFPSPKDKIPNDSRCGIVYNIKCDDCTKVYIGQTKNSLATRLGQHRAALRLMQPEKSALAEHSIVTGHKINWADPRIVERESRWHQRLFLESWHTTRLGCVRLNRCEDHVPAVYRAPFTKEKFKR